MSGGGSLFLEGIRGVNQDCEAWLWPPRRGEIAIKENIVVRPRFSPVFSLVFPGFLSRRALHDGYSRRPFRRISPPPQIAP